MKSHRPPLAYRVSVQAVLEPQGVLIMTDMSICLQELENDGPAGLPWTARAHPHTFPAVYQMVQQHNQHEKGRHQIPVGLHDLSQLSIMGAADLRKTRHDGPPVGALVTCQACTTKRQATEAQRRAEGEGSCLKIRGVGY